MYEKKILTILRSEFILSRRREKKNKRFIDHNLWSMKHGNQEVH
jgi:hypothetical protein